MRLVCQRSGSSIDSICPASARGGSYGFVMFRPPGARSGAAPATAEVVEIVEVVFVSGQIVEARVLAGELDHHLAGRTVTLLGDDQLRYPLIGAVFEIV